MYVLFLFQSFITAHTKIAFPGRHSIHGDNVQIVRHNRVYIILLLLHVSAVLKSRQQEV